MDWFDPAETDGDRLTRTLRKEATRMFNSLRASIVFVGLTVLAVLGGSAHLLPFCHGDRTKTLSREETARLYGGIEPTNTCCGTDANSVPQPANSAACGTYGNPNDCNNSVYQYVPAGANTLICNVPKTNGNCMTQGTGQTCLWQAGCVWSNATQTCGQVAGGRSIGSTVEFCNQNTKCTS